MKEFAEQYEKKQQLLSPDQMYTEVTEDVFGDPEKNETITDIQITYETIRLPQMRVTCTKGSTHTKIDIANMGNVPVSSVVVRNESLQDRDYVHVISYQGVQYQYFLRYHTGNKKYEARFVEPLTLLVTPSSFAHDMVYDPVKKQISYSDGTGVHQSLVLRHIYATKPHDLGVRTDAAGVQWKGALMLEENTIRVRYTRVEKPVNLSTLPPGRLVELRGTDKLQAYGIRASVRDGVVSFSDTNGNVILQIDEADYAETMKKTKAIYTHDELGVVNGKSYQIKLTSLGSGKAIVEALLFTGGFLSFDKKVFCYTAAGADKTCGITTTFLPDATNWTNGSVQIHESGASPLTVRFRDLSAEQLRALSNADDGYCLLPVLYNGTWKMLGLANKDRIGSVALSDLDTGLYNSQLQVKSGAGTTGSRVANVTLDADRQIDYVRVQQSGRTYSALLDSSFIDSLKKFGATATKVWETADGGKYSLVGRNVNGNLQITVVTTTAPTQPDLVEQAKRNKVPLEPIIKPKPPAEETEEDSDDEHQHHDHEYDPTDEQGPPSRLDEENPWGDTAINKERMKTGLVFGNKEIEGFYEFPKPFMGANEEDLKGFYILHGGSGIFTLMYDVPGPFNDDQRESNKIDLKQHPDLLNGQPFTVKDDDKGEWMVKLYVSPDNKLGFFLRPPLKRLENRDDKYEVGIVDGPPSPLAYPTDDPGSYIYSGMDAGGVKSKTKPRAGHYGVDIPGIFATTITAPASGKVVYIHDGEKNQNNSDFVKKKNKKGQTYYQASGSWGNYIILKLPNNCYVRLGHLTPGSFSVKEGDLVIRGHSLGKMGRSGKIITGNPARNKGNGGVHVHMEYFRLQDAYLNSTATDYKQMFAPKAGFRNKVKKRLDPEIYLTRGLVSEAPSSPSRESSPSRSFERSGHPKGKNFPAEVIGNTPQERLDNFMRYMGYDVSYMREVAREHGLDESLIPAIIRAEYGKGVPSNNNPGNITLQGKLVSYASPQEGILAMAEVLNNRYQSSNMTIGALNGYGRQIAGMPACTVDGQYCYAMDTSGAWHTNVTNFMSFVYNKKVDYTYKFRRRATTPESGGGELLKKQPKSRISSSFSYSNVAYTAYLPQLSPPVGQDRTNAPWGRLISVESAQAYLITPEGKKTLSSGTVTVGGEVYTVNVKKNSTERLFPNAAEFTLKKK